MTGQRVPAPQQGIHVDESQFLLLKAIIPDESGPLPHYARWRESIDFDNLDGGSFRLLPMLYKRLEGLAERDELFGRIKGVYRYTLFKNSLVMSRFDAICRAMTRAGSRVMLLKGGALLLRYYDDIGLRAMNDIDIMLEGGSIGPCLDTLHAQGWRSSLPIGMDRALELYNSAPMLSDQGFELDLHRRIMTEYGGRVDQAQLWKSSLLVERRGVPVRILGPEDQIMHTCAHGVKWNALPPIRWIPDLMAVLEKERSDVDWDLVAFRARERHLTTALMTCLRYVSEHFGARGLGEPLRTLSRNPVTPREVRRFLFFTSPPRRRTLINRVRKQWMLYNSVAHEDSGLAKVSRFPLFLLHKSGCAGLLDGCRRLLPSRFLRPRS